jgi:hypothetical protein
LYHRPVVNRLLSFGGPTDPRRPESVAPAADAVGGLRGETRRAMAKWTLTTVDDLTAAEELLDTLENAGFRERELLVLGNASFAVRWR